MFYESGFPDEFLVGIGDSIGSVDADSEVAAILVLRMLLAEPVHDLNGVQTGILSNGSWNNFEGPGERVYYQLGLAGYGACMVSQVPID